jgi:hypothetical protein
MYRRGSVAINLLLSLIIVILVGVAFWYFSEKPSSNTPSVATSQAVGTGNTTLNTSSSSVEYQTPYGYKFSYPNTFRIAHDYNNLISRITGQGHLTLTMASQAEEVAYVAQVSSSISQYTSSGFLTLPGFFVNQSIFIGIAPGSFSDLTTPITKMANPQFEKQYISSNGHKPPASITDLEFVSTEDGVNAMIYVYQDNFPLSSSTPLSVRADLPYQPQSLKAGVDYIAPAILEFSLPINSTSSALSSEATLQYIINSLKFD